MSHHTYVIAEMEQTPHKSISLADAERHELLRWYFSLLIGLHAAYNLIWGLWMLIAPGSFSSLTGLETASEGMNLIPLAILTVLLGSAYIAFLVWPARLFWITFMGGVFSLVGFMGVLAWTLSHLLELQYGLVMGGLDVIGFIGFGGTFLRVYKRLKLTRKARDFRKRFRAISFFQNFFTDDGRNLFNLARQSALFIVFVPRLGNEFARRALVDLEVYRKTIEHAGAEIVLLHTMDPALARPLLKTAGLGRIAHISDPDMRLIRAFERKKNIVREHSAFPAKFKNLGGRLFLGPVESVIPHTAVFHLPGAFLVAGGKILKSSRQDFTPYCEVPPEAMN